MGCPKRGSVTPPSFGRSSTSPPAPVTIRSGRPCPSQSATAGRAKPRLWPAGPRSIPSGPGSIRNGAPPASIVTGRAYRWSSPLAQVLQVMEPTDRIAIEEIQVLVGIEIAGNDRGMTADQHLARSVEDRRRHPGLVPRRAGVDAVDMTVRGSVDQLGLPIVVDVAGRDRDPVIVEQERSASALQGSRLHEHGGKLAAEITIDLQQPAMVRDQQLETAAASPGNRQGSRMKADVQAAGFSGDLGLKLEAGFTRSPDVAKPEDDDRRERGRATAPGDRNRDGRLSD